MNQTVLVTGGTGYIGSHFCVEILQAGFNVVIVDNLCNSNVSVVKDILSTAELNSNSDRLHFERVDLRDAHTLDKIFTKHPHIRSVFHFAGLKAVGESHKMPLNYYENNITGTLNLLHCMVKHNIFTLIYSSSATVYGDPSVYPMDESSPTGATSPYGRTKLFAEAMINDIASQNNMRCAILRYFNPVGAHPSGILGESPLGIPNNLMPYLGHVSTGLLPSLTIYGGDYFTIDGTGVRDYIHAVDLVRGHLAALKYLDSQHNAVCEVFNLGTGVGYTVKQVISAYEEASGKIIPFIMGSRRPGDVATLLADSSKAQRLLNWQCEYNLDDMCKHSWLYQSNKR